MPVPLMNRIIRIMSIHNESFDREKFTFINLYGSTEVAGDATELQIKQRLIPSEVKVEYQDERQYELPEQVVAAGTAGQITRVPTCRI